MTMQTFTDGAGASVHYRDVGAGRPVLALHGAYSTHAELVGALEPILAPHDGYRRLYPDLTGMGESPAHPSVRTTGELVDLLERLIDDVVGDAPLLVVGHSYGAHLARALAARRPQQVEGLALICPMIPRAMTSGAVDAVDAAGIEPEVIALVDPVLRDDYAGYFTVHTATTAERFNVAVAPSIGRADPEAVAAVMTEWVVEPDPDTTTFEHPTLIVTGRLDSTTGYRGALGLLDRLPRATFAAVADAGHALPHERPELLAALIVDWLAAV